MRCKRCKHLQPEELIEIDVLDYFGCSEVIIWCCEKCGDTFVKCSGQ